MCNNCIHKAVCSIYRATGGVKKCEHHREERKGKWVVKRMPEIRVMEVNCSACGWRDVDTYDAIISYPDFNFCPNCGADMRGAEDGN